MKKARLKSLASDCQKKFDGNVKIGAGVKVTKKRAQNEKFYSIFFKKSREWKGQSPGVRIESGHLKNRLPAVRRGRHFPQAGNRAFSQVVRLFFVAAHRLPFWKAITSENCGFVLCTKCGPCRTARKQFSKGLRSKTGVQQHPKNNPKNKRPGVNRAFPYADKIT